MDAPRYQLSSLALAGLAVGHAVGRWPMRDVAAFVFGGLALATAAELVAVRGGLLVHNVEPAVAGVPLYVPPGWVGVVYVALRVAELVVPAGPTAAAAAAGLAAAGNLVADPRGFADGVWSYPAHTLSGLRFRGVPWWSYVGWLGVGFATAMLRVLV